MTSQTPEFDPRFDPAFQRGFRREARAAGTSATPAMQVTPVAPEVPIIDDVTIHSGRDERAHDPQSNPATPSATETVDAPAAEGTSLRGNPWVRALWIVAAVCVVFGVVAQWRAQMFFFFGGTGDDAAQYVAVNLMGALGEPFLLAGLAAGIGAMLLHAVRWRPRR